MTRSRARHVVAAAVASSLALLVAAIAAAAPPVAALVVAGGAAMLLAAVAVPKAAVEAYRRLEAYVRRLAAEYGAALLLVLVLPATLAPAATAGPGPPTAHVLPVFEKVSGSVEPGGDVTFRLDLRCVAGCGSRHQVEVRLSYASDMREKIVYTRDAELVNGDNFFLFTLRIPRRSAVYMLVAYVDGEPAGAIPLDAHLPVRVYATPGAVHVAAEGDSVVGSTVEVVDARGRVAARGVIPRGGRLVLSVPAGVYTVRVGGVEVAAIDVPQVEDTASGFMVFLLAALSAMAAVGIGVTYALRRRSEALLLEANEVWYRVVPARETEPRTVVLPVKEVAEAVYRRQERNMGLAVELDELAETLSVLTGGVVKKTSVYALIRRLRGRQAEGSRERLDYVALPHPLSPVPKIYMAFADRRDSVLHRALIRASIDALLNAGLSAEYVGKPGRGNVPDIIAVYTSARNQYYGYVIVLEAETGSKLLGGEGGAMDLVRGVIEHTTTVINAGVTTEDRWRYVKTIVVTPDEASRDGVVEAFNVYSRRVSLERSPLKAMIGGSGEGWRRVIEVVSVSELPGVLRKLTADIEAGRAEFVSRRGRR